MENEATGIPKRERWVELAELAEKEQDPKNLLALVMELNRVLDQKYPAVSLITPETEPASITAIAEINETVTNPELPIP